jgi:t-SNARE complex subunit (syntaxin)
VDQANKRNKDLARKTSKIEENLQVFDDLKKLSMSGENMVDGITKHVMASGFNSKIRELRKEFFSKAEFKNESMKFMSKADME